MEVACHFAPFKWQEVVIIKYVSAGGGQKRNFQGRLSFKPLILNEAKVGKKGFPLLTLFTTKEGTGSLFYCEN